MYKYNNRKNVMNDLVSIIVPIYNVEKYLNRCIRSIVAQTYENIEIILVDDGSSDSCPEICDNWSKTDTRIKVIHKMNGGLSDARNVGMAIATGDLMGFVDGDDWIAPEMYQNLYERMKADDSDIAACGVKMIWDDRTPTRMLTKQGCCVLNQKEAMRAIIEETWLKEPVWYKLYRRSVVDGILFPVGKYHEDVFWSYQTIGRASKVSVFDEPCYYYRQRSESIMNETYSLKRLDSLEAKILRLAYVREYFPQLEYLAENDLLFSCVYSMQMSLRFLFKEEVEVAKKRIEDIFYENKPYHKDRGMSLKQSIWFYLAQISFERTCRIRNLLNIGF